MSWVAVGVAGVGLVGKALSRHKANNTMDKLIQQDPNYATSAAGIANNKLASGRLSLAQTLLNARMPGAARAERNIYTTQANQLGSISRNATDSSQALALGASTLGQTNQAFDQLSGQEAQDYQRRYGDVENAQEGVINEQNKQFQDDTRRFGDTTQFKGAQAANRAANWGDLSNFGFGLADFGASGGFGNYKNPFGNSNGSGGTARQGVSTDWLMQNNPYAKRFPK